MFPFILQWKFAFLSLGRPEYLQDSDIVSSRFQVSALSLFPFHLHMYWVDYYNVIARFFKFIFLICFLQRRDVYGAWEQYLGLEHSDNAPKRAYAVNQVNTI